MKPQQRRVIVIGAFMSIFVAIVWYGIDKVDIPSAALPLMPQQQPLAPQQQRPAAADVPPSRSNQRLDAGNPMIRRGAGIAQTLSKAREIGIAFRKYAEAHDGRLPAMGPASPLSIQGTLSPYVKDKTIFEPPQGYEGETPIFRYAFEGGTLDPSTMVDTEIGYVLGPDGGRAIIYASGRVVWQDSSIEQAGQPTL